ncbi:AGL159W-Ap [Eremothecium gossypii ATCC 10895]|uniref:AGL159W-Ap n=1 Tax=Eremothecium gossypii (strain ATCC 10895 / CBS 109.51 / FGSC 9923 / NRRL Y-1056) TaxID=284811 RepID=D8FGH0_EREGS|nr:AGL159W-Ap [Eremothecium gossypii ATCC 10895]ADJ41735.1 AGL159W-Ap [Eremothecium gossypii ATCC 10895]AEY98659.1 FAGL159W-Ap [Eremothecium gossypii FDAG1]
MDQKHRELSPIGISSTPIKYSFESSGPPTQDSISKPLNFTHKEQFSEGDEPDIYNALDDANRLQYEIDLLFRRYVDANKEIRADIDDFCQISGERRSSRTSFAANDSSF